MPRCAAMARCGACSVAPAQMSTRSMSRPLSATVFICRVFSAPSRHTVTDTVGLCTARSTSRNRFTTLPSIASKRSPGSSSAAAGDPATSRLMPSTWRRCGLCSSKRRTHSSGRPNSRAPARDCTSNSASKEYSGRPSATTPIISLTKSDGMPRLICSNSRCDSNAKLDHIASTSPFSSVSTPS